MILDAKAIKLAEGRFCALPRVNQSRRIALYLIHDDAVAFQARAAAISDAGVKTKNVAQIYVRRNHT